MKTRVKNSKGNGGVALIGIEMSLIKSIDIPDVYSLPVAPNMQQSASLETLFLPFGSSPRIVESSDRARFGDRWRRRVDFFDAELTEIYGVSRFLVVGTTISSSSCLSVK
jgi:hypothetical protein